MATERKAAGDTCWRDGAAGGVHPLEKQEKRPSPAPIDPVSCYVVAAALSSSRESPTQIKATVVISTRDAVEAEKGGGAGRMRWSLARKRLAEWSYVLDRVVG
ncbi:hypothetical protein G5I_03184 [Acromyrmex echinatior]|uniref:Uncharacterized protein n=1 Tax=Acromyrmex echinatior TaxID=103372 RepID=F4WCB0_ACREC|nr:hypothetical protein G5I_03184 [Acromyrmex echinatior]